MVCKSSEEVAFEGSGDEIPVLSTLHPVSIMAIGSVHWGSEAGITVGEAWGQEEDEDTFMACQVQVYEATEAECEALKQMAENSTQYKLVGSESPVDVNHNIDLFPELSDCD